MATKLLSPALPLRVAFFGCDVLLATDLRPVPDRRVELVALADHNLARAGQAAARLRVANAYGSVAELLAADECDAVFVAGPPERQAPAIVRCLEQDKYVLAVQLAGMVERDARSIVAAARRSRGAFAVGCRQELAVERSLRAPKACARAAEEQARGGWGTPPPPDRELGYELARRLWAGMRAVGLAPAGIVVLDQVDGLFGIHHAFADETGEVLVAGKLPTPDADRLHIRNRRSGASLELPLGGLRPRQPREITLAEMLARASGPVLAIAIAGPGVSWRVELSRHDQPDLVRVDVKLDRPGGLPWPLSVWNAPSAQSWGVLLTQVTRLVASI